MNNNISIRLKPCFSNRSIKTIDTAIAINEIIKHLVSVDAWNPPQNILSNEKQTKKTMLSNTHLKTKPKNKHIIKYWI